MALNSSWESPPPFGLNGSAGNATGGDGAILDEAVNAVTTAILVVTMVSLGCTMEIEHIGAHIRKPRGIIIAVLAQFGIMPVTAFALAKVFRLNPVEAVTVLICGCCPGGNLSNVFALALDGDMNLSILMTTCSTVLALGMMPLLLWAYSHGLSDTRFVIPYAKISIALALILLPCAVGIFINAKFPKYSRVILRVQTHGVHGDRLSEPAAVHRGPQTDLRPASDRSPLPLPSALHLLPGGDGATLCAGLPLLRPLLPPTETAPDRERQRDLHGQGGVGGHGRGVDGQGGSARRAQLGDGVVEEEAVVVESQETGGKMMGAGGGRK
ncbi:hepatic sodium/bile acid cotransporter isoform X2 [Lampetra fluviatilis]